MSDRQLPDGAGSTCPVCKERYFFECLECGYVPSEWDGDWTVQDGQPAAYME